LGRVQGQDRLFGPRAGDWTITHRGNEVYFAEPGGQYRLLIVDQTKEPEPDLVKDWKTKEAARIASTIASQSRPLLPRISG
jgi:hypothetical protein